LKCLQDVPASNRCFLVIMSMAWTPNRTYGDK
jgi:hypothetical protein